MKISEDVRKYARENGIDDDGSALTKGMEEKSKEFLSAGGEIYSEGKAK
jgi:phosphomethylpyrimidine synthase